MPVQQMPVQQMPVRQMPVQQKPMRQKPVPISRGGGGMLSDMGDLPKKPIKPNYNDDQPINYK